MGLFQKIVSWIADKIIRPIVEWITKTIQWLVDSLAIMKHEFFKVLGKWLENDLFFLGAVLSTIAVAVFWPKIAAWFVNSTLALALKKLWEDIKKGLGRITEIIHFIDLVAINRILKVVWPEYRKIVGQFETAVSSLAKELGEGSGYIHAYFGVVRSLAYVGNSFLGTEPELAELEAFEATEKFLSRIDKRFEKYRRNPGAIAEDIIEDIYLPYATRIRDAQQSLIDEVRENYDRSMTIVGTVSMLQQSLDHFIEVQPVEMAGIVEERLGPFRDTLAEWVATIEGVLYTAIGPAIGVLEWRADKVEEANTGILARMKRPDELIYNMEFLPDGEQEVFWDYLRDGVFEPVEEAALELQDVGIPILDAAMGPIAAALQVASPMPALRFEPSGIPGGAVGPADRPFDWFVGEW